MKINLLPRSWTTGSTEMIDIIENLAKENNISVKREENILTLLEGTDDPCLVYGYCQRAYQFEPQRFIEEILKTRLRIELVELTAEGYPTNYCVKANGEVIFTGSQTQAATYYVRCRTEKFIDFDEKVLESFTRPYILKTVY